MGTIISGQFILSASANESASTNFTGLESASSLINILVYDTASGQLSYTSSATYGLGTPGGSNTQIQYNSGSTFAGTASFAFIYQSQSLQQGNRVTASGLFSHAEGSGSAAVGAYSHVEGTDSYAGQYGYLTQGNIVSGTIYLSQSYGDVSSQFGSSIIHQNNSTNVRRKFSIDTENNPSYFDGTNTIVPLVDTSFNSSNAGIVGAYLITNPTGANSLIGGSSTHAEGNWAGAIGNYSHAEGYQTVALGNYSHAEGAITEAVGFYSHAEGFTTIASGAYSHAEGENTQATGIHSHAEGSTNIARAINSHAEGYLTLSSGTSAHAEGTGTIASGIASHAEGSQTQAVGSNSHAEGNATQAIGASSHAEGSNTVARGDYSHAEGNSTIASGSYQTVVGSYNTINNTGSKFVVGIGGSSATRKDGFTVDADANLSGSIMIPTNTANPSTPKTGSMYYNTSTNMLHIYNGVAWRSSSFS